MSEFSKRVRLLLATPVSGASLALFRVAVGLVMALEAFALVVPHDAAITSGTPLEHYYAGPDITFNFPYEGFQWVPLLPPAWMYGLVAMLGLAGVTMAIGLWYRASVVTVFALWAYFFVVESTRTYWQSHYYLELLLTFLLIWMPAARRFSVDAWRGADRHLPRTVPYWTIFLLRCQLVIAYFYAGVAKLHADWLLDAVPVRWFLADPNVTAPYEPYLTSSQLEALRQFLASPALAYFISYTGAAFDLCVGFLLLFRRTRIFALVLMVIFHATNHLLIFDDIGWFPIVGAGTALIFLDPDWPERFWSWLRRPRLKKPDWTWAAMGAIVFPVVGFSLGWKLPPTPRHGDAESQMRLRRFTVPLIACWLVWQSLLPVRHHLIASDARFTYEGFSFSWRLKADTRHVFGHTLYLSDPKIISPHPEAGAQIDWNEWRADDVLYRIVNPGQVVWPGMPEVAVVLEPFLGERIIYNPYSGLSVSYSDAVAHQRVRRIWQQLYGRQPKLVYPLSLSQATERIVAACELAGTGEEECSKLNALVAPAQDFERGLAQPQEALVTIQRITLSVKALIDQKDTASIVRPILRTIYPLALQGEVRRPAPFFIIDDPQLFATTPEGTPTQVSLTAWKHDSHTQQPGAPYCHLGPTPLIVYMGAIGANEGELLPLAYITDFHGNRDIPPRIRWNSLKDLTMSKFMHTSGQAFYLRRYARRVAALWESQYDRRPEVLAASTGVSYNGRPHQPLVDPDVDLASVPVSWFRHNSWIRDLEMKRIPRDALVRKPLTYGYTEH